MISRVLIAGGGTGGHLYPGLAVAERLRLLGADCRFVGTRRGLEAKVVPERGFPLHRIYGRGLAGRPWQKALALLGLVRGFLQSSLLLRQHRPQLVIATGGYVCAPVILAAGLQRIPIVLLEQNALPGKVNRFFGGWAQKVCLSFEESRKFFPADRCKLTGNPVREEILEANASEARQHFQIPQDRPVMLITGASQGANSLNEAVLRALPHWRDRPWTILHLTGSAHHAQVSERARTALSASAEFSQPALDYRSFGYMGEMHWAYRAANLVVSRAGATTLAEITACGLPAVLVPYPFAADRHQDYNADSLVSRGAAVKLADSSVVEYLADTVSSLMEDSQRLGKMAQASLDSGRPEALHAIVELIERNFGSVAKESPLG